MDNKRSNKLNNKEYSGGKILYWMSRDQRVHDNWALLYAQELAQNYQTRVEVVFCLRERFDFATERLVDFMLTGLKEVAETLRTYNIPFSILLGDPSEKIVEYCKTHGIGAVISDFSPLKYNRAWKKNLSHYLSIPLYEVDTHNIVPVWIASPKQEFGAYTLRPKIHRLLPTFLTEILSLQTQKSNGSISPIDWERLQSRLSIDHSVKKVTWITPGEKAARLAIERFVSRKLSSYALDRNDPVKDAQSNLSPYLHFGHLSAQRVALRVREAKSNAASIDAFLEELIIRKELSDNYCYYNPDYDNPHGFPAWAQKTLDLHASDKREFVYRLEELEEAKTHDTLWNSAQKEMRQKGKMHGYMRMYWAKKIFEWSKSVKEAQKNAMYLNDKYFLDGRDPNGYTGIAWSMGGVHDRAWFEREVFGKIRYMNYNGEKSKFAVDMYIKKYQ